MKSLFTKQFDLASNLKQALRLIIAFAFVAVTLLPLLSANIASAAQLTSRKVNISTSKEDAAAVEYDFTFSFGSVDARGLVFEFCTTPLGACSLPTGMDISNDLVTFDGQTNFPTNATTFAEQASNLGGCSDTGSASSVTQYCLLRASTTPAVGTDATIDLGAVINPNVASVYQEVYIRIELYSDASFATLVHEGVVAAAIVNQLTVNGRVQERLEFCVAAVVDDEAGAKDSATDATTPTNCSAAPTATTVDIGIIDNSSINTSPVNTTATNGANDAYGIAMVNTNAASGVAISYFVENASSGTNQLDAFRVTGASCNATASTTNDPCFYSAASAGTTFSAGSERFGLQIPCIDTTQGITSTLGAGGTGSGTAGTYNTAYSNTDDDVSQSLDCENEDGDTGVKFAWAGSTTTALVSSTSAVDDEIIKLRFGATAEATTPRGTYTVVTTYIATPTF